MWGLDKRHIDKGQKAVHSCLDLLSRRIVLHCVIVLVLVSRAQTQFHKPLYISNLARTDSDQGRDAVDRLCTQSWNENMRAELMSLSCHPSVNQGKQASFQIRGAIKQPATYTLVAGPCNDAEPFTRGFHLSSRGIPRDCTVANENPSGLPLYHAYCTLVPNMVPIITVIFVYAHPLSADT